MIFLIFKGFTIVSLFIHFIFPSSILIQSTNSIKIYRVNYTIFKCLQIVQYLTKLKKKYKKMADFPQDLNYGVALGDPQPKAGTGYNPPPVNNVIIPKTTDEQAAAGNDKYDLKKAAHPAACVSTFIFKGLAIFFYLIIGSIIDSKIITFILVILFSSLDFWVVKNVTGRLLVGLRWWSQIDSKGKEQWRFQNPNKNRNTNRVDNAFFWTSQIAGTAVWAVLFLLKVLTLSIFWCLLVFVCLSLCGTNLYAYYLCRGDHKKKVSDLKKQGMNMFFQNVMA